MLRYRTMTNIDVYTIYEREKKQYQQYLDMKLNLDLTRGKPSDAQLAMITALGLDDSLSEADYKSIDGTDIRNYGNLFGLPESRAFFAEIMGVDSKQVMVLNNSSLTLMYDFFSRAMLFPLPGSQTAWSKQSDVKVLCPAPGYDRHFAIAEGFGLSLIPIDMTDEGPDMDQVEAWVKDPTVKAMFCVPLYSNPGGVVYSEAVCERLAAMTTAPDFRIIWDNAYCLHHLDWDKPEAIPNVMDLAAEAGNPNRFIQFMSTSKITYAGSGLAAMAASEEDFAYLEKGLKLQTIGPDKVNQRRHLNFFAKQGGIESVMRRHAAILKPKFDLCLDILDEELGGSGIAEWSQPSGGYFISLDLANGQAKRVVQLAGEAGVKLTPAGSTFPYGNDPDDRNIRLSPTYPDTADLEKAMKVLCTCVKLSAHEMLLAASSEES